MWPEHRSINRTVCTPSEAPWFSFPGTLQPPNELFICVLKAYCTSKKPFILYDIRKTQTEEIIYSRSREYENQYQNCIVTCTFNSRGEITTEIKHTYIIQDLPLSEPVMKFGRVWFNQKPRLQAKKLFHNIMCQLLNVLVNGDLFCFAAQWAWNIGDQLNSNFRTYIFCYLSSLSFAFIEFCIL